jgi:hypothetical protein
MIGNTGRVSWCGEPSTDWSLLEFSIIVEVGRSLELRGVRVEFDCGMTDEGDPWLVFCDADSSELLCHVARLGKLYVACLPFGDAGVTGTALTEVLDDFFNNVQGEIAPCPVQLPASHKKI